MPAFAPELLPADPLSLTPLVRENRAWVEAMARRHLGDPALAEEVAQDVFLRLARLPRRPEEEAALRSWLLRTVWYLSANARRKAARRRAVEALAAAEFGGAACTGPGAAASASAAFAAASLSASREELPLEELAKALDSLPELERMLVLEHYFEGREHGEIGSRHRLSGEAARKRISRALNQLRSHLTRRGVLLPAAAVAGGLGAAAGGAMTAAAGTLTGAAGAAGITGTAGVTGAAGVTEFAGTITGGAGAWQAGTGTAPLPGLIRGFFQNFHSPLKSALLTAAACAAAAAPLVIQQRREIGELRQLAALAEQREATARALPAPLPLWSSDPDGESPWTPRDLNADNFPDIPPMAQWIVDSLPALTAAARSGDSGEPLNLRVSLTMSESITRLIRRTDEEIRLNRTLRAEVTGFTGLPQTSGTAGGGSSGSGSSSSSNGAGTEAGPFESFPETGSLFPESGPAEGGHSVHPF